MQLQDFELEALRAQEVRLPDPRPQPPGTRPVRFMCRHGRVALLPERQIIAQLQRETLRATGVDLLANPESLDVGLLLSQLRRVDIGSDGFRIDLREAPRIGLAFSLRWRHERVGETAPELIADDSAFRRALEALDPKAHTLEFNVWDDSFDAYLVARRAAERIGFRAGWSPFERDAGYEGALLQQRRDPLPID